MFNPDLINGCFEFAAACMIFLHCRRLYIDKKIRGVSWVATVVFTLWGFYNVFYYPHLDQMYSFYGGLWVVTMNCLWLGLMYKYRKN